MSKQHALKIHPKPLADLLSGAKTCEVRFNDRGFEVGDTVRLQEIDPATEQFTGRPDLVRVVTHVQQGYGLPDHLCVLSYAHPAAGESVYQWREGENERWWTTSKADYEWTLEHRPDFQVRILWTAPPAAAPVAAGEPVYQYMGLCNEWVECKKSFYEYQQKHGYKVRTLWITPPAAAHGDEAVRKDATESAIQRACGVLPEGWSMQIDLERDAGWVTLFDPWGRAVDFGQDFGSIGAHVEAAIDAAMSAQAGEGGAV